MRVEDMWCDKWTLPYIYQAAMAEHIQLWGVGAHNKIEYLVFTEVRVFPASRFLEIVFMIGHGGDLAGCVDLLNETLHKYAQVQGCRCIEILQARDGWEKKLPKIATRTGVSFMTRVAPKGGLN